jgi:hypothetical protein
MTAFIAESFDREIACTEREWLGGLPRAIGDNPCRQIAQALTARIGEGQLVLSWRALEPRVAGQARTLRLLVSFRFSGLDGMPRYAFMKRFDLTMPRSSA